MSTNLTNWIGATLCWNALLTQGIPPFTLANICLPFILGYITMYCLQECK